MRRAGSSGCRGSPLTTPSPPSAARTRARSARDQRPGSGRGGRHKFKHDEVKMYYHDHEGANDGAVDVYDVDT